MRFNILVLILLTFFSISSHAIKTIKWQAKPIKILLVVDQEKVIYLPGEVLVKLPTKLLDTNNFRSQALDGSLLLTAYRPFKETRVQIALPSGKIILIDLTAIKKTMDNADYDPIIKIVFNTESINRSPRTNLTVADLVRYASQSLYAPHRLVKASSEIRVVAHRLPKELSYFYDAEMIKAMPIISWKYKDYYITAIELWNLSLDTTELLDPLKLRLEHVTHKRKYVAFQHGDMKGQNAGIGNNETTVYIVSKQPLREIIVPKNEGLQQFSKESLFPPKNNKRLTRQ